MSTLKQMYTLNKLKDLKMQFKTIIDVPGRGEMLSIAIGNEGDRIQDCVMMNIMLDEVPRGKFVTFL